MSADDENVTVEDFIHRRRHCFFGDRLTHFVRPVPVVNQRTACRKWVWDKASKSLPRSTSVTCPECVKVVAQLQEASDQKTSRAVPAQGQTPPIEGDQVT